MSTLNYLIDESREVRNGMIDMGMQQRKVQQQD